MEYKLELMFCQHKYDSFNNEQKLDFLEFNNDLFSIKKGILSTERKTLKG